MAVLLIIAALAAPCACGWLTLRALDPNRSARPSWPVTFCQLALGTALGLGLSSCAYYVWLVTVGHASPWYFACEVPPMLISIAWAYRKGSGGLKLLPRLELPKETPVRLMLGAAALTTAGILIFVIMTAWWEPWSHDDAVTMWTLKARIMFLGGDGWNQLFANPTSGDEYVVSPDYPLFLPSAIARCWSAAGRPHPAAPLLLAIAFWAATLGLCGGLVARLRAAEHGWLAALTLLGTVFQAKMVTGQCADIPLSCFVLAVLACVLLNGDRPNARSWILPGFFAGLAAWTKNEGLVFACVWLIAEGTARWLRGGVRDAGRMLAGCVPAMAIVLAVVFSAKILVVPFNGMMKGQGISTLERFASPQRYFLIAWSMVVEIARVCGWHLLIFAGLWQAVGRPWRGLLASRQLGFVMALVLMLGADCGFYLITPFPLQSHLSSSLNRLLLQIWPAWVALFWIWYGGLSSDDRPSAARHRRGLGSSFRPQRPSMASSSRAACPPAS